MEQSDTNEPDKRAERQTEETRHYGVQFLTEKCPRAASLYFFGFGIWVAVVGIALLLAALGLLSGGIPRRLMSAGVVCFTALSILLSLMALWDRLSRAMRRAPHENPARAAQETPAERPVQRFAGRYPRLASAHLYGYGISQAALAVSVLLYGKDGKSPLPVRLCIAILLLCFTLLSVPVAVLALRSLRKKST